MRTVFALVRHGEYQQPEGVPSALLPHPLSERGQAQARELAQTLLAEAERHALAIDDAIDSSPLLRAWQTATIVAESLARASGRAFAVREHEALCERSVGAAANLTLEQISAAVASDPRREPLPPDWKGHPTHRLPFLGAESLMQAGARVAAHLEARARSASEGDRLIVVVGHGGALRHAAVSLGVLEIARVRSLSMHHCGHVLLERVDGDWTQIGGKWKVRASQGGGD